MNPADMYSVVLLALCIWREAQGESTETRTGVAWTIRNRVNSPGWWGHSWVGVILMPYQFSSFNSKDPNATKLPGATDPAFPDCLDIATKVWPQTPLLPDPTNGATSYFDKSLDADPPKWATDGSNTKTVDLGALHFYKLA